MEVIDALINNDKSVDETCGADKDSHEAMKMLFGTKTVVTLEVSTSSIKEQAYLGSKSSASLPENAARFARSYAQAWW